MGQRIGAGDLHFHVHATRAHVQSAAEDVGEAQDVVDLVRIVAPPGGDDGVGAHRIDLFRGDLRIGVGHGEDDRLRRHMLDQVGGQGALGRQADEDVGAGQGFGQGPLVGVDGVGRLPLVHVLGAAAPQNADAVDGDDVVGPHAHGLDQLQRGDAGGARAVQHDLHVLDVAAADGAGVDQAGGADDRRAVLVVVEHRDVEQLLQLGLDAEALGALDVLEVDAAEGDADVLDDGDDLVGIGGRDLDVDGVDVGEALEEHPLALHHRLGGQRAEIAQAQDGRAVGDHRHQIALGGVVVGRLRILGDLQHRHGDARRIGQRQIPLGGHRLGGNDGDLARGGQAVETQRLLVGEGAFLGVAHRAREILTGCGGGMSGLTLPLRQGRNNLATPRMKVPAGH
jgi:hypothetical protein